MNRRERVIAALNHKEPDRVPIDVGGTHVTSICKQSYHALREYLGLTPKGVKMEEMFSVFGQIPVLDMELAERLHSDVRPLSIGAGGNWKLEIKEEGDYYTFVDEWGAKLFMPRAGGHYFDYREFPIKEASIDALRAYKWPDPSDPARYAGLREEAGRLYKETDYALAVTPLFGGGILEQGQRIMDMQEFLISLVMNERFADYMIGRLEEIFLEASLRVLDEVGSYVQVLVWWDDLAGQEGPLINPSTYRRLVKPRHKRIFEAIKEKAHVKIFMHTCGAVYDFIPDLIESGVDILNPVQVSALNMQDTKKLKREFGKDLVFWGGSVNPQRTLPFGSPDEVRAEVRKHIEDLTPGGGYVFASIHNIQNLVPPENIVAMFDTACEAGHYRK